MSNELRFCLIDENDNVLIETDVEGDAWAIVGRLSEGRYILRDNLLAIELEIKPTMSNGLFGLGLVRRIR